MFCNSLLDLVLLHNSVFPHDQHSSWICLNLFAFCPEIACSIANSWNDFWILKWELSCEMLYHLRYMLPVRTVDRGALRSKSDCRKYSVAHTDHIIGASHWDTGMGWDRGISSGISTATHDFGPKNGAVPQICSWHPCCDCIRFVYILLGVVH